MNFIRDLRFVLLTVLAVPFLVTPASAQNSNVLQDSFSEEEVRIIREVFEDLVLDPITGDDDSYDEHEDDNKNKDKAAKAGKKNKGLPPGLAKRDGDLPPGLAKQVEKNGQLPPGLAKRDLPDTLSSKLPERGKDRKVVIVDDDVVLLNEATGVVLDILRDVVKIQNSNE